jgi:hypothetical protein
MNSALVIGISNYPPPIPQLPAVSADVREVGKLLASPNGSFKGNGVATVTDADATGARVMAELEKAFSGAGADDTVFAYLAGHGSVGSDGGYYFVAHDTSAADVAGTGVPLARLKQWFDACPSRRVFLWLDFCHSGGILARRLDATAPPDDQEAISRALAVVKGHGKLIFAACTPGQSAYEDAKIGHGLFTAFLLEGLRGAAASHGEVTATSLYDFIDRRMGSDRQRPMLFGQMTGRVVLMHYPAGTGAGVKSVPPPSPAAQGGGGAVDASGNWCLLGDRFFTARSVRQAGDGSISVKVASEGAGTDSAIADLKPDRYGQAKPIPYAYRNDAYLAHVTKVESDSTGGDHVWTVTLKPSDVQYGGGMTEMSVKTRSRDYSADEIAEVRAGRLLLNNPPAVEGKRGVYNSQHGLEEMYVQGLSVPVPATACVLQTVYRKHGSADVTFLQTARLAAIFMLKASHVCEQVLELRLGPVVGKNCAVEFRGRRRAKYANAEPVVLTLKGECPLE